MMIALKIQYGQNVVNVTFIDEFQPAMQHCQTDGQKAKRDLALYYLTIDFQNAILCPLHGTASTNFGKETLDGHSKCCWNFHLVSLRWALASGCSTASQTRSYLSPPHSRCSEKTFSPVAQIIVSSFQVLWSLLPVSLLLPVESLCHWLVDLYHSFCFCKYK